MWQYQAEVTSSRPAAIRVHQRVIAANLQPDAGGTGRSLLPIARRPAPFRTAVLFTDRIALAFELAGPRAAKVAFALKVIDARWEVTPYKPITGAGHASGRIMAYGLGESWRPR
jgi:hypothetical protein